jgi:DNA-binding transcriptional regulator YdaS (Cro superfamily)
MKQREFPFLASMPHPTDAPSSAVARCTSERDAFVASMKARCGSYKQSWFAAALGVSGAYISQIKSGDRNVPDWMVDPFCALTGTNLLRQYRQLQQALRAIEQRDSDNARTDAIASVLRNAA